jgi:nucleoside-diphosphate-sugar epimerase
MSRVLVLGGTGFVGPFIVKQLVDRGDDVTLFHRGRQEPPLVSGARHIHGDFGQFSDHVKELAARHPDVVIDVSPGAGKCGHGVLHFAGVAGRAVVLTSMDVYRAMAVIWGVEGTDRLQEMPVTEDADLRKGASPDLGADLAFDNLVVERAVAEHRAKLPATVLRCPVIYGPFDRQRRLRHYVRRMIDKRSAIVLDARLARFRLSRGYVENIAAAVVAATADDRSAGMTYNVAELEALSEIEWVRSVGRAFGWDGDVIAAEPTVLPTGLHVPLPAQDLYGDTSRIRSELGYSEPVAREEGLRRAVQWEQIQQKHEPPPEYAAEDAALRAIRAD